MFLKLYKGEDTMSNHQENYEYWLNNNYFDQNTKDELIAIKDNEDEIKERFYKDLEFGTGGLRGILGSGTNRMNIYTVRKATQGFANYILQKDFGSDDPKKMGVAISFDCRNMSKELAEETALVFNANGIKTFIYPELRPTPQLSFTVRHLGCCAGIMVTASHNPPEYNGYKVYDENGSQVSYPDDEAIIEYVNAITDFATIKTMRKDKAEAAGLFNQLGTDIDDEFLKRCLGQAINTDITKEFAKDITIVYSPFNGAGNKPVRAILDKAGFKNVYVVKEQEKPDGNFPTLKYPNPEDPGAFELAIKLAKVIDADIVLATDPDADRVGVAVKDKKGEYTHLSGNVVGVMLADYILGQQKAKGMLPDNPAVITSIVSSNMTKEIAKNHGINYYEVLTGFKWVGAKIKQFTGKNNFVYAFEESYGYVAGTYARDKDSVGICMLICEMAAYFKSKGMTFFDGIEELYKTYGYHKEGSVAITIKGITGAEKIKRIMDYLSNNSPTTMGGQKVIEVRDYNNDIAKNPQTGATAPLGMAKSNVLYYMLEDETWFCVRPSGTEPKIKIYVGVKGESHDDADGKLDVVKKELLAIVDSVE